MNDFARPLIHHGVRRFFLGFILTLPVCLSVCRALHLSDSPSSFASSLLISVRLAGIVHHRLA